MQQDSSAAPSEPVITMKASARVAQVGPQTVGSDHLQKSGVLAMTRADLPFRPSG